MSQISDDEDIPGITWGEDDSIGKQMLRIALRKRYSLFTCNVCRIMYVPYRKNDNGECPECSKQPEDKLDPVFR